MHPLLNTAVRAAREAGRIIVQHAHRIDSLHIQTKARNDFVSEVDRMAEAAIVRQLHRAYPDHAILAEEGGRQFGDRRAEYEWVIDPLDGTTNFLYGIPHYAVSIGLRHRDRIEQGVIYDPVKDELFTASRGEGAQLDGRRIRVNTRRGVEGALLGTGIPFREGQPIDTFLETLRVLIPGSAGIRRAGSAALDFAYVAAGRLDGYWEFAIKPWDMAAGILLVEEAGGMVGDLYGGKRHYRQGDVAAGAPRVFTDMLRRIAPVVAERAPRAGA